MKVAVFVLCEMPDGKSNAGILPALAGRPP